VRGFEKEGHPGIPTEEWPREETGFEIPREQRPPEDSPGEGAETFTERIGKQHNGPEAPESIDLSRSSERPVGGEDAFVQKSDVELPEVEDKPIEELDVEEIFSEEPRNRAPDGPVPDQSLSTRTEKNEES
jgi:hypothetical protein